MAADCLPAAFVEYPHVGQQNAIFDYPAEVFQSPARVHRPDHHLVEHGGIANLNVDGVDFPALNRVDPFVAGHREWTGRPCTNEHEIGMNERAQLLCVLAAQSVAPIALQVLNQLTAMLRHTFPSAPSLRLARKKANLSIVTFHDQRRPFDLQLLAPEGDAAEIVWHEAE